MTAIGKLCRTCLKESSSLSAIYEEHLLDGIPIYEVINDLLQLGVHRNDGFPKYMCQECYIKIEDFEKFKKCVHAAKNKLEYMKERMENIPHGESCNNIEKTLTQNAEEAMTDKNAVIVAACIKQEKDCTGNTSVSSENEVEEKLEKLFGEENNEWKRQEHVSKDVKAEDVEVCDSSDSEIQCLTDRAEYISSAPRSQSNLPKRSLQVTSKSIQAVKSKLQSSSKMSMKTEIKEEVEYVCDLCEKSYPSLSILTLHKKWHEGPFHCIHCGVRFVHKAKYIKHTGLRDPQMPYKPTLPCDTCQKRFPCITFLQDHEKRHTETKLSIIRSLKSSDISSNEGALGRMYLQKLGLRGPGFYCEICGKRFKSGPPLERHKRQHTERKQFECDVCSKIFKSSQGLIAHKEIHIMEKVLNIESHQSVSVSTKFDGQNMINTGINTRDVVELSKQNYSASLKTEGHNVTDAGANTNNPGWCGSSIVTSAELEGQSVNNIGIHSNDSDLSRPSHSATSNTKSHNSTDKGIPLYKSHRIRHSYSTGTNFGAHNMTREALNPDRSSPTAATNLIGYNTTHGTIHPCNPKVSESTYPSTSNHKAQNMTLTGTWSYNPNVTDQSFSACSIHEGHNDIKLEATDYNMESIECSTSASSNPAGLNMINIEPLPSNTDINRPKFSDTLVHEGQNKIETEMEQYNFESSGTYSSLSSNIENQSISHTESMKFQCPICGEKFILQGSFEVHMRCHMGIHQSHISTYTSNTDTKELNVTHNPEPRFKCNICEETFFIQSNLNLHMKCHVRQPKVTSYICGRGSTGKSPVIDHSVTHTVQPEFDFVQLGDKFIIETNPDVQKMIDPEKKSA